MKNITKIKLLLAIAILTFVSACNKSNSNVSNGSIDSAMLWSSIKIFDTSFNAVTNLIGKSESTVSSFLKNQDYLTGNDNGDVDIYSFKNTYSAFNTPSAEYYVEIRLKKNQVDQIAIALMESKYTNEKVINVFRSIDSSMRSNNYTSDGLELWQKVYNNKDSSLYKVVTNYSDSTLQAITDSSTLQFQTNYTNTNSSKALLKHATPLQLLLLITQ